MPSDLVSNTVRSMTTHTYGRTLNATGDHAFIIDGTRAPAQEVTPIEVFLSAVASCGVQWVERFAQEDGVSLFTVAADITGFRLKDQPNEFHHVTLHFTATGMSEAQAETYVARFEDG